MVKTISFNLVQSPQPYLPLHKKFLMLFDLIQQRSSKISFLPPKVLLTKNRKDIEYRVEFLRNVIDNGLSPQQTLYYNFISDNDKGVILDVESVSKDFISLYNDIKNDKIFEPISIGQYSKKIIKTRYILNGKKIWKNYMNENGFQVINGGHRLAVALFLGLEKVPVKIFRSLSFEIPNYTDYIRIKEPEYRKNLR
ncbi:MAG: hypothetical protein IIA83_00515 [Thaumarchaeota archaeon]|nr:hypothetical protein [Nitrososphaerota archaeon]